VSNKVNNDIHVLRDLANARGTAVVTFALGHTPRKAAHKGILLPLLRGKGAKVGPTLLSFFVGATHSECSVGLQAV
jgi:hypothetical protein